jgi:PKD repeat protein
VKRIVLAAISAAFLVACEQDAPTANTPAPTASALLNASPSAEASIIRVSVLIDGRSQLILRGNTAQWHHFDHAAPGRWGRNDPTTINAAQWFPAWPGFSGEVRCGGCFSDVFGGVSPALPAAPVVITVTPVRARVPVVVLQQPSADNNYTAVVEFNDNGPFGGDTYTVDLAFTYAPPTASAGGPYTGAEGTAVAFDGSGSAAADGGALTYAWDFGDGATSTKASPAHVYADNGTYTVTLAVTDAGGSTASATTIAEIANVAPSITALELPATPVSVGTAVAATASFSDPGSADTHSAQIDWGDGSVSPAVVAGGSASATRTYAAAGVYTVVAQVGDDDGGTQQATFQYVVVYDPTAGFVTGGGWIDSPPGAYAGDAALTGKATFGFVSKYLPGANKPSGNTEFQFKAGTLNFRSTSYDWLVVAGAQAKYKGEGTINSGGAYGFMLTAIDGALAGGGGTDAFRIKIWDLVTGAVVYDNKLGSADDSGDATALGGGGITIHK